MGRLTEENGMLRKEREEFLNELKSSKQSSKTKIAQILSQAQNEFHSESGYHIIDDFNSDFWAL